ncbi:MAG: zf-HC2 domain-containing protein [Actinomycetota bacterium]|nr:zf-HC2 domain-containing protein [Actinomycetota bacterium]
MRLPRRPASHGWSQEHLSHYIDGDLSWLGRKGLELHAAQCPECSLGIRALRGLVRLIHGAGRDSAETAPAGIFDRVRADAAKAHGASEPGHEA